MAVKSYRDLTVWQRGMGLVENVYQATREWPRDERFELTNQVRRAVVSIPANIAEGQGRGSDREVARFLAIAHGSLYGVETHLLIAQRLDYFPPQTTDALCEQAAEISRLLRGLKRTLHAAISEAD